MQPSRPDSLLLRMPIFVCLAGVVTGNCLTYFVKNCEVPGRWVILISLAAGLLFALLYTGHILFCRLHQRLSDLIALLAIHALMMTVVAQSFHWLSRGTSSWRDTFPWNILFLTFASLTLLTRANILALVAANCLPDEWTLAIVVPRKKALILREERRSPRWYICAFYWGSPLAWWLLLLLCISLNSLPVGIGVGVGLFAVFIFLQLRVLLGGFVYFHTAWEWWKRRKPVDIQFVREARWYLFGSALPAAGLLAIYSFCFAATRIHQDAMAATLAPHVAENTAALRALQPPPLPDSVNAATLYKQAWSTAPRVSNQAQFSYQWNNPETAEMIERLESSVDDLRHASKYGRCAFITEYGADLAPDSEIYTLGFTHMALLIMLHARFAASDEDWETLLENAGINLSMANHLHQQPNSGFFYVANRIETITILTLIPALLRNEDAQPPDDILDRAQLLLRSFEIAREGSLSLLLKVERLRNLRKFDRYCATLSGGWPGEPEALTLFTGQPVLRWKWRDALLVYHDWMAAAAADPRQAFWPNPDEPQSQGYAKAIPAHDMVGEWAILDDSDVRCEYRLADAALAASRFKNRNRRWPVALQDCVPEFLPAVPVDPLQPEKAVRFEADPPRVFTAGVSGEFDPASHGKGCPTDDLFDRLCGEYTANRVLFFGPYDPLAVSKFEFDDLKKISVEDEMNFLASDDSEIRGMTLRNLSKVAPYIHEPKLIPYFLRQLDSMETHERIWAVYILGRAGFHAHSSLARVEQEAAQTTDPTLRHFAREAARRIRIRHAAIEEYSAASQ